MPIVDDTEPMAAGTADGAEHRASGTDHGDGRETMEGLASMRMKCGTETPAQVLDRLRSDAAKMKSDRRTLMKNLKNARRQNARLKAKARKLSNSDLLAIVAMRSSSEQTPPGSGQDCARASSSDVQASPEAGSAAGLGDVQAAPPVDMERLRDRMEL